MKNPKLIHVLASLGVVSMLLFGLCACGQGGPLYMPDDIPKSQRAKK